jgi:hypothetical protein
MDLNLPFQYLDFFPPIPDDFLINYTIREKDLNWKWDEYRRYTIDKKLQNWLATHVYKETQANCQVLKQDIMPHCDLRNWALNYIINPGGENVFTTFYKIPDKELVIAHKARPKPGDPLISVMSVQIEPKRWHILNTHILHGVTGITDSRSAITIHVFSKNPFQNSKL